MKNLMKKRLNNKGFTLVELIVVIAIVAVLAVVGIPAIAGQVAKANKSAADANAKTVATQASIAITDAEVAGKSVLDINTAGSDVAAICKAAGIDQAKAGTVAIVLEDVKDAAGTAISKAVKSVTITKGGTKIGEWTRGS